MDATFSPDSAAPAAAFAAPWRMAAEAIRQQADFAAESASVLFRGFEALGRVQSCATRDALDRHTAAARLAGGKSDPMQLAALPLEMMRFDLQGATDCWQQMLAAAFEMQARLFNCGVHLVNSDAVLETAAAVDAAETAAESALQAAAKPRPARRRTAR